MFVLAAFLVALKNLLDWFFSALIVVIFLRVLLSWVNADPYNGLVRAVYVIAEPFLRPFRRLLPPWKLGGIDLSPLFACLALGFLREFLVASLVGIIQKLQ